MVNMISKINFTGKVYYLGETKKFNQEHMNEIRTIQTYANDNKLDIAILSKDSYTDNSGYYTGVARREDSASMRDEFRQVTFDFGHGKQEIRNRQLPF